MNWVEGESKLDKIHFSNWMFTEPGKGSDRLDCHFSFDKKKLNSYISKYKGKICLPENIYHAFTCCEYKCYIG